MKTITFNIEGMTCGGCVNSVSNALKQVAGVSDVQVSLENQTATISFDDAQTNEQALKEAIDDTGFDVVNTGS